MSIYINAIFRNHTTVMEMMIPPENNVRVWKYCFHYFSGYQVISYKIFSYIFFTIISQIFLSL